MKKLVFIMLISQLLFSQEKLTLNGQYLQTGIDNENEQYFIFNNPEFYYSKNFNSDRWIKKDLKQNQIPISDDFPYNFFHIKKKNYLVHKGGGTVYEFKNDSIVRIDNSFEHKNQFSSSSFVYNDEIYYFGGYGLFTFKNILTKFDLKTKVWELVKYKNYKNIPESRANSITFIKEAKLYLIGGLTDDFDTNLSTTINKQLNDVWELNLKTKEWNYLGELNDKKAFNYEYHLDIINDKLIYDFGKLYEFNFDDKTLKYSEPKDKYTFSYLEKFNPKTNELFYILGNSDKSNIKYDIIIEPIDSYKSEFIGKENLIAKNLSFNTIITLLISLILCGCFLYFLKFKNKRKLANKISLSNSIFYHKEKRINNLSNEENDLLYFLFQQNKMPIPMNEVVDFFSKNNNEPYNTLTKKKDLVLSGLKQKLSLLLEIHEEELFLTQKSAEDKRIKEIQLNPRHFLD